MISVYSCNEHYNPKYRYHLNNIIKSLWNERSLEERVEVYGDWIRQYRYASEIQSADVYLLTYHWNYYLDHGLLSQAQQEIDAARAYQKPVIIFSAGDSPANVPFPGTILFESAGYRSSPGYAYHSGMPFFTKDYLQVYCGGKLHERHKTERPVVGFCGQADSFPLNVLYRRVRNRWRRYQYRTGRLKWEPPPFETTFFRRLVLRQFENRPGIRTNYLLRKQYHAGNDQDKSDYSTEKLEFVNNILDSDYTVCLRGGGNFSIRIYETLALGRIPIFIDTDCLLPFEDKIPYRELFPWVRQEELPRAAEILTDFHRRLSNEDFIALQHACRKLWEQHFTSAGFHSDFCEKIDEL